ncbi:Gfo/Idh/MocA family oxidoreductase [Serratia symbiotica]|uniref:Gfo/Idh/MocA family oxidoreductase n=1 Tax=Serratia symbiotica TaxID=138074 RepID=UPI0013261DD7|nr:Gfo/Idh/MocA family oxidoreductase [Serratia symbiotica]QTP14369.1 Gfo/Idh/MocA family oxidoreductase [Serratia symbiotica]
MNSSITAKQRVLIVGAKFGEIYLNAFIQPPEGLELMGLLAQGSSRSRELAFAFGIPLYTSLEQLPETIDIACIVVRSTVAGGSGTQLAKHFLTRGVHVIQEHPLHPDDLNALQALAQENGCCYWVNSFYPHTHAGRTWINDARQRRRCLGKAAQFAQVTTSCQLLYSSLGMLLLAQGVDATTVKSEVVSSFADFHALRLYWPDGEACLLLQRYLDPADPDMHSLIMHRQLLSWPEGYLSLDASYGPVIWSSSLYVDEHQENAHSLYRRPDILHPSPALTRCTAPLTWRDCCEIAGPAGVAWLLQQFRAHLAGTPEPPACHATHQVALSRLWQQVMQNVGNAEIRHLTPPHHGLLDNLHHQENEEAL